MVDVHLMFSEVPGQGRQCRIFADRPAAVLFAGEQAARGAGCVVARLARPSQAQPVGFGDVSKTAPAAKELLQKLASRPVRAGGLLGLRGEGWTR